MGRQTIDSACSDPEGLVSRGVLSAQTLEFLEACLQARLNMAISGPVGSGKRALLHSLIPYLGLDGQILIVQNPEEPSLDQGRVTSLRARPQGADGSPAISRSYLLTLVPKMHPAGLILDRVEGAEVVPLLRLLLSMDGIVLSVAADSPSDAMLKLEELALAHGAETQPGLIRRILSTGLQLIVQLGTPYAGSSAAASVTEIVQTEENAYLLRDIFVCNEPEVTSGETLPIQPLLQPTGARPVFLSRLESLGITLRNHVFEHE
jgi:pilus assembly protein CpaF